MKKVMAFLTMVALLPWGFCQNASAIGGVSVKSPVGAIRIEENFNRDWRFAYGELPGSEAKEFDETAWCDIALPHSFSIPYDLDDDRFYVGTTWYRKNLTFLPIGAKSS